MENRRPTIVAVLVFLFSLAAISKAQESTIVLDVAKRILLDLVEYNTTCSKHLLAYGMAIANSEPWAIKMLDASSKIQSGLLRGNMVNLGDFNECLLIEANTTAGEIRGQHCLGTVSLPRVIGKQSASFYKNSTLKTLARLLSRNAHKQWKLMGDVSICVPDSCSAQEINTLLADAVLSNLKLNGTEFNFTDQYCQSERSTRVSLDTGAVLSICFFLIIGCVVALSTFYDYHVHYHDEKPSHEIYVAFSAYTNAKKLFNMKPNYGNEFACLHGIRSMSILWIVFAHTYAVTCLGPLSNMIQITEWVESVHNRFVVSAEYCVDTFLVMSGCLLTYNYMQTKHEGKSFNLPLVYFHRFNRIMSPLAPTLLVYCTLLKYFGSGPWWPHIYTMVDQCNTYWWTTLLNIQNLYNIDKMCIPQSWYLSIDMQLFTLTLLLLFPLWKYPRSTLVIVLGHLVASTAYSFHVAWKYQLRGLSTVFTGNVKEFYDYYYNATPTRAGPYFIGIILGYLMYKQKLSGPRLALNKVVICLLWLVSLVLIGVCCFAGFYTLRGDYKKWDEAFYISFIRLVWALAVAWIIFACSFKSGGIINKFLSMGIFLVIGRLSYSIFILHGFVIMTSVYSRQVPFRVSDVEVIHSYWGHLQYSALLSIVWVLMFEFPVANLLRLLGGKSGKTQGSFTITRKSKVTDTI